MNRLIRHCPRFALLPSLTLQRVRVIVRSERRGFAVRSGKTKLPAVWSDSRQFRFIERVNQGSHSPWVIPTNTQYRPAARKLRQIDILCLLIDGNGMRAFTKQVIPKLVKLASFFIEYRDAALACYKKYI